MLHVSLLGFVPWNSICFHGGEGVSSFGKELYFFTKMKQNFSSDNVTHKLFKKQWASDSVNSICTGKAMIYKTGMRTVRYLLLNSNVP